MTMIQLNKTWKLTLAGILILGTLMLIACAKSGQPLRIGEPVPNFKLSDIKGNTIILNDYKGKMVLIHFWETSYEFCTGEMPFFQALHEEWTQSGEVVLLTLDPGEGGDAVSSFMKNYNYTFPVLLDTDAKIAGKYNVTVVPTSILIDKDGNMKFKVEGPFKDKTALDRQLAAYIP